MVRGEGSGGEGRFKVVTGGGGLMGWGGRLRGEER